METERDTLKSQLKHTLSNHVGSYNPITAKELSNSLKKDERLIRLLIRELISDGIPVASNTQPPPGYFLISNFHEARRYADSIKSRLIEDALRRRDFNKSASLYLKQTIQGRLL